MKISVICPVKNEVDFIGYSIMAANPFVHEFIYTVASDSNDGTIELLRHLKTKIGDKLRFRISTKYAFNPHDMAAYNQSFNDAIDEAEGDAVWFLHPDMIVTEGVELPEKGMAWYTEVTSYAADFNTVITKGRCDKWKNIHAKQMGLHYFGGYGSQNEDFYHSDITGKSYKHYGSEFSKYPFRVTNSGIKVNHYCELKGYARRLEKMELCLRTLYPDASDVHIKEMAVKHPRVTLENSSNQFGVFEFEESKNTVPDVFTTYKEEFDSFRKELVHG